MSHKKSFKVYHTEGSYRLVRFHYGTSLQHTYVEHACLIKNARHGTPQEPEADWTGHIYAAENAGWECSFCKTYIPEGLQALFWFMKTEGPTS